MLCCDSLYHESATHMYLSTSQCAINQIYSFISFLFTNTYINKNCNFALTLHTIFVQSHQRSNKQRSPSD